MRNCFDQLAKRIGHDVFNVFGTANMNDAINPETQYADLRYEPDPSRTAERDRAGLLGRLGDGPCIIEVYSDAPNAEEFRACLAKHLAAWQQRARKVRSDQRKRGDLLSESDPNSSPSTLLIRLMAAGPLLAPAVRELAELPPHAYARTVATPILLDFKHSLGPASSLTPDEQEFLVAIHKTWAEERAAVHAEALATGRTEGLAQGLLAILRVRRIAVPADILERIHAEKNHDQLQRWSEKAAIASSLDDVFE